MKSNTLFWLLMTVLLITFSPTEAQQPKKIPRIGYLAPVDAGREVARSEAIRLALRERGYIEGQNIAIEFLCGGKARSGPCACRRAGAPQG